MSTFEGEITKYKVIIFGGSHSNLAKIACWNGDVFVGKLQFQDEPMENRSSQSGWFSIYYNRSSLSEIVDILRNEKPIYYFLLTLLL